MVVVVVTVLLALAPDSGSVYNDKYDDNKKVEPAGVAASGKREMEREREEKLRNKRGERERHKLSHSLFDYVSFLIALCHFSWLLVFVSATTSSAGLSTNIFSGVRGESYVHDQLRHKTTKYTHARLLVQL